MVSLIELNSRTWWKRVRKRLLSGKKCSACTTPAKKHSGSLVTVNTVLVGNFKTSDALPKERKVMVIIYSNIFYCLNISNLFFSGWNDPQPPTRVLHGNCKEKNAAGSSWTWWPLKWRDFIIAELPTWLSVGSFWSPKCAQCSILDGFFDSI